jgi:hypothetical protein
MFVPDLETVIREAPGHIATAKWHRTNAESVARVAEERRGELVESLACLFNAAMDDEGFSSLITGVVEGTTNDIIDRRAHSDLEVFIDDRIRENPSGSPQSHQHETEVEFDIGSLGELSGTFVSGMADE